MTLVQHVQRPEYKFIFVEKKNGLLRGPETREVKRPYAQV